MSKKRPQYTRNLTLGFLVVATFLLAIVSFLYFNFNKTQQKLTELFMENQLSTSRAMSIGLFNYLSRAETAVLELSSMPKVKARNFLDPEITTFFAAYYRSLDPDVLVDLGIIDQDGILVNNVINPNIVGKDFRFRDYFKTLKSAPPNSINVSKILRLKGGRFKGQLGVVLTANIHRDNQVHTPLQAIEQPLPPNEDYSDGFRGIIAMPINIRGLMAKYVNPIKIGELSNVWVISERGDVFYNARNSEMISNILTEKDCQGSCHNPSDVPSRIIRSSKSSGTIMSTLSRQNSHGMRVTSQKLVAYSSLFVLGQRWYMVITSSSEALESMIRPFFRNIILLLLLVVLLSCIGLWSFLVTDRKRIKAEEHYRYTERLEHEIKERTKELEKTHLLLAQNEKLITTGRMAAGFAHEINNPLAIIMSSLQLYRHHDEIAGFSDTIASVYNELQRISNIVNQLSSFVKPHQSSDQVAEITLQDLEKDELFCIISKHFLRNKISIKVAIDPDLPNVAIPPDQFKQVMLNILKNAEEGLQQKTGPGVVTITASRLAINPDKYVEIRFKDNGCGIDKSLLGKIFDPFFTEKGARGTGLGLYVSYGIITSYGGDIKVRSEPGKGAEFCLTLPFHKDN